MYKQKTVLCMYKADGLPDTVNCKWARSSPALLLATQIYVELSIFDALWIWSMDLTTCIWRLDDNWTNLEPSCLNQVYVGTGYPCATQKSSAVSPTKKRWSRGPFLMRGMSKVVGSVKK